MTNILYYILFVKKKKYWTCIRTPTIQIWNKNIDLMLKQYPNIFPDNVSNTNQTFKTLLSQRKSSKEWRITCHWKVVFSLENLTYIDVIYSFFYSLPRKFNKGRCCDGGFLLKYLFKKYGTAALIILFLRRFVFCCIIK